MAGIQLGRLRRAMEQLDLAERFAEAFRREPQFEAPVRVAAELRRACPDLLGQAARPPPGTITVVEVASTHRGEAQPHSERTPMQTPTYGDGRRPHAIELARFATRSGDEEVFFAVR